MAVSLPNRRPIAVGGARPALTREQFDEVAAGIVDIHRDDAAAALKGACRKKLGTPRRSSMCRASSSHSTAKAR